MSLQNNRNLTLDNAKVILIFAVVFGHMIEPFIKEHAGLKTIYIWLYSFHMPAFILISGMLSRGNISYEFIRKLVKSILIPLLVFNILYEITHWALLNETSKYFQNGAPYWVMWYLLSLFIWRTTLPIIEKIPFYLPLSISLALLIGLIPSLQDILGLGRTLYFWPLFLLGTKLTPKFIGSKFFKKVHPVYCVLFLTSLFIVFGVFQQINPKLFYGKLSYLSLGQGPVSGMFTRVLLISVSTVTSLAFIRLIPEALSFSANLKNNTLYVYLWHGLFIKFFIILGMATSLMAWPFYSLFLLLFAGAATLTFALSSKVLSDATSNLIFNPIRKFF